MIRVFGQELDQKKLARFALLKVYGIGHSRAQEICKALGITNQRVHELDPDYQKKIQDAASKLGYNVEEELRRSELVIRKAAEAVRSWRAERRRKGLPCRGQQTRRNARTARRRR